MHQDIISGCKHHQPAQQRALFEQVGPVMMTVCRRYAISHADAADILQESFIKIFRSFDQFDETKGPLMAWMRRIVVNTAIQHWRKWHKNIAIVPEEYIPETLIWSESELKMEEEEILQLIQELPPGFRMVFNLFAIEGYTHAEIAGMLGIAESASRSQLARARKHLQQSIHDRTHAELYEKL